MAEIGMIASVIAVVGAGAKLSILAFDFAASIGKAGQELQIVASEISSLCSVLKQLQTVLEHAHFRPSLTAVDEVHKIIQQCQQVFTEIDDTLKNVRGARGDDAFPSVDFVSKVKWTFGKKSKILVLRSTLEACKSTLSVMLITMILAERVSQRKLSSESDLAETEQEKAVTQSLIIAQQCALDQLEVYEDQVEKEEKFAVQLPGHGNAAVPMNGHVRRKSRGRLFHMFTGLSVITDLPTPSVTPPRTAERSERVSVWLDSILALPDDKVDPHPGKQRQKRLSSAGTANAPYELLRKWTDQAEHLDSKHDAKSVPNQTHEIWQDSIFSFSEPRDPRVKAGQTSSAAMGPIATLSRAPTDLISPKTARVQSIGFHMVLGVDGDLETGNITHSSKNVDDDYAAIASFILQEHGAQCSTGGVQLCVSFGGKTKVLKQTDKPLEVLRQYEELELDPRLFIRRAHAGLPRGVL